MKQIKVGILGCGRIEKHYQHIFKKLGSKFKIVAVCDIDKSKRINSSKIYKCAAYKDKSEMASKIEADLILILTPSGYHYEHSKFFLKKSFNVIVEKPITMNPNQAEELIKFSRKKKLFYSVVFQNRFNKPIQSLRYLIDKGYIGKVVTTNIKLHWCRYQNYYQDGWHGTWKNDGGVVNQQAIHHIDILNSFFGPIKKISAFASNRLNKLEAEDTMNAIYVLPDGSSGTIECTTAARSEDFEASISIVSEKAYIKIGGIALNEILTWRVKGKNKNNEKKVKKELNEKVKNGYGNSHYRYLNEVYKALNKNSYKSPVNLREAISTTRLIHAIYKSIENKNKWIDVNSKNISKRLGK